MSRRASYHIDTRFTVSREMITSIKDQCSSSGKFTYVTSSERLRVFTIKGVPGKFVDVLIPDDYLQVPDSVSYVCEIGLKIGSFDGNKRWRIAFRSWEHIYDPSRSQSPSMRHPAEGKIQFEEDGTYLVAIARWYCGGIWAQSFTQMRYKPDPGSRIGIFMYQWKQWFRFLDGEEARKAGEVFDQLEIVKQCEDIVSLNRMASAMLYDLAVALGWRKLTLKEKGKYGLTSDSDPWQRVNELVMRLALPGTNNGCGEYTNRSASGKNLPRGICLQCEEPRSVCRCSW